MSEIRYNPDVLSCIANLSSDEVFTPPQLANRMLDALPADLWNNKRATFLDPGCKSGVFLREIVKRLDKGLEKQIPNRQKRLNHIFENQVFGLAITELTALISRRSLYCSKTANGKYSVCEGFSNSEGNIRFNRVEHTWSGESCKYCGANKGSYKRPSELESHAYSFIHTDEPEGIFNMKFDVVVGNPPYQLSDGGGSGSSAVPIYHKFVESALQLKPRYVVMITPSRWFAGGKGLDDFRTRMLKERRFRNLVDYPKLYDGFPGVKIRGGISYFLWDRDYSGPCTVQTMWDGKPLGKPMTRYLDAYDVLVRRNEAVSILDKVRAYRVGRKAEITLDERVSSRNPFGFASKFQGKKSSAGLSNPVKLYGNHAGRAVVSWIERRAVQANASWIDDWKVLVSKAQGTSAAVETKFLSNPILAKPGEVCTETYLVAGRFDTEDAAAKYADYLRTRFVRFLISLRKLTHNAPRGVYAFVPDMPLGRNWTDERLYKRYNLTDQEIAFIESIVKPMQDVDDEPGGNGDDE